MALPFTTQIALGAVIAGAAFYMISTGTTEGVLEYVYVDKVVDHLRTTRARTFKMHGTVVPGTVRQKIGAAGDYTFEVEKEGRRMPVHFTNMVPDTFAEGGEVVLTGRDRRGSVRVGGDGREVPLEVRGAAVGRPEQKSGDALMSIATLGTATILLLFLQSLPRLSGWRSWAPIGAPSG
jgi:cytochrome c-type biogenesis protein CcmE